MNHIEYVEPKQTKMAGNLSLVTEDWTIKTHKHLRVFISFSSEKRSPCVATNNQERDPKTSTESE